ncbi:MAG TPA: ATP-binding protein [Gammaproteobacteria bacterium]|jgi:signal transduction histidine kinase|nr:ATP-binding protein [Gammaproteobacteria bacterium]
MKALIFNIQDYLPWAIVGLGITFLIAALLRVAFLSRQQAISLDEKNKALEKETSERIAAEETKQKLEVALLQGQKLQAIGTLAGGIAHDFNNLLYAIIGYVELSREDLEKDSLIYKNLGKVLEATHRGQDLIARILAFSRKQHHEFDILPLRTTILAALALLKPTIPASVNLAFTADINPHIFGNQTQLHQVLVNLINNAVDAMDGEGNIHITVTSIPPADPLLKQLPNALEKEYCKIDITDTGHGMDQATMERIFEPFFTTKDVGHGTGLGLSIVHSIVEEHKGHMTVTSQIGKGTHFTILLPQQVAGATR